MDCNEPKIDQQPKMPLTNNLTRKKMTCSCPYCQATDAGGSETVNSDGKQLHNCYHIK